MLNQKDILDDLQKLADARDQYLQEAAENPITYQQIKEKLISAREDALEKKNANIEDDTKKKKLDPYDVARILVDVCSFVMFFHGSKARLATYDVESGIYTYDDSRLRIYISYVAPRFNKSAADTVIYHLTNMIGAQPAAKPFSDPKYVPVGNGIYEPATHTLYPYKPTKFVINKIQTSLPWEEGGKLTIKRVTHPVLVPEIKSPRLSNIDGTKWEFDSWLMTIANNDKEIYDLLWQVLAVVCNSNRQMGKAIFLLGNSTGTGNNGKGTFQKLVENLVGDANYETLKVNQFSDRFALEKLVGKSVVIGDDNPTNVMIKDKSNFNSIVTNDPVTVEPKGEKAFTTTLNITTIQSCNAMPRFADDGGVYRRMIIVPFNADFNGMKENKAIKEKYLATKDVLQYVLYKALDLGDFEHYSIPRAAKKALSQYEHNNNPVSSFIDDVWKSYDGHDGLDRIERLPMPYLYKVWKEYAKDNGYHDMGKNTFNQKALTRINEIGKTKGIHFTTKHKKIRKLDAEMILAERNKQYRYVGENEFPPGKTVDCLEKEK